MFFFLSKTLNYLTTPLAIVSVLLLMSAILKKYRKRLFWTGFGLLLFFCNDFIASAVMRWWEVDAVPFSAMDRTYEYGIVLTGATRHNMEVNDRVYFQRGADRVTHTVQLYKLGLIKKILVSGGSGRIIETGEYEADDFYNVMIMMGVPDSVIMLERESRNTHESAVNVTRLLDRMNVRAEDCLLITSAFHQRRSLACFKKEGTVLRPFAVDFYTGRPEYTLDVFLAPQLDALILWHKLFKEWVGITAYWVAGYV